VGAITAKFREYAAAAGIPHSEFCISSVRDCPAARDGEPKAPVFPEPARVSIRRQGVMAIKMELLVDGVVFPVRGVVSAARAVPFAVALPATDQFFSVGRDAAVI
jgi:hypothetical protein